MATARNNLEIEVKVAVASVAAARRLLRAKGFRVFKPRAFESNQVFDTPDLRLRNSESLLRVRKIDGKGKLTYKAPPRNGRHKCREELEVTVGDAQVLAAIFTRLGFQPVFRYDKYRTEFRRGRTGIVTIDETPIGAYMEIEGPPQWIDRTARLLGYTEKDYILLSYGRLYVDWCARNRRQPGDMVFPPS